MRMRSLRLASLGLLLPRLAFAEPRPTDARSASVALLDEAKRLAAAGKTADACAKYAASYSLDAQLDALLPLADCLEQGGKLASAYAAFHDAVEVAQSVGDQRWAVADERSRRLQPRLSYMTIDVPHERRLPALSIDCDGFRVGSSGWGVPIPVDPGSHVIVVNAYGYRAWQASVDVHAEGDALYVEVPLLEKTPDGAAATAPATSAPAPSVAAAPPPVATPAPAPALVPRAAAPAPAPARVHSGLSRGRVAALVAGGVGVASLGFGFYFLGKTQSTLSERDGICPTSKDCAPGTNAHLGQLTLQARNARSAEIGGFAVAAAAAAIGAGLWLTSGKPSHADHVAYIVPLIAPRVGGLAVGGRL